MPSQMLTDEHKELRLVTGKFLDRHASPDRLRQFIDGKDGDTAATWTLMASQLGMQAILVPERFGGLGYGPVELSIVMEEMGRRLYWGPFLSTAVLAVYTLMESGDEAGQTDLLTGIASGERTATLAVLEDGGTWAESAVTTVATGSADGWTLRGTKRFVLDGHTCDTLLVAARTGAGVSLFVVDGSASNLTRHGVATMDPTRSQADIHLHDTKARMLGDDGDGWNIIERVLERVCIAVTAEQAGGMRYCLEMSAQYAKDRIQFGRPIGSFQAIKQKCADMLLDTEAAVAAAHHAMWSAATSQSDRHVSASVAKAFCSEAYSRVALATIQVHGGIGFTWEHQCHLYLKRAKSSEQMFGSPRFHRDRLATLIAI